MNRRTYVCLALLLASPAFGLSYQDVSPCEPLTAHGQYHDINDAREAVVRGTVESNHFTPEVETLQRGLTAPLPRDIAFVLRAFPNHHRALNSMARWQLQNKAPLDAENDIWTADCYFLRAIDFRPDDWRVQFVYGIYLHRAKRLVEADKAYDAAAELGADTPDFFYNRGLLAVDRGNLQQAGEFSDKATALGHPLKGLRDKLARARKAEEKKTSAPAAEPKTHRAASDKTTR
jgi:Tfp pilus assembly protein PilF